MSKSYTPRTTAQIAQRIVQDIPDGAYVNLGIGQPMSISNHLPPDKEIILQSENGVLGMGPHCYG
jgi:3-oxoadipate CoA-transferase beta subunit